ncbi:MAG TPA: hypothetical protein VJP89_11270 [Pyrinomonadaceae bacterium]|nr:hypothetical protein [Pyrinomonadaceae bacterium]
MTFGALFTQVLGFFDRRFQVTYFLPSLLFWGVLIVIWYAGKGDVSAAAHLWTGEGTVWIVRLIAFFAWLVIFSNVLASQSLGLLRLYEGYWNFPGSGWFRRLGQRWHQRKLAQYDAQSRLDPKQYQYIHFGYPLPTQPEQVMPTQLGNILKNSELYSHDRYQLDAVVMWPRLYNLFPAPFAEAVIELRMGVDFMLVISFLSAALAFVSGIYLVVVGASPYLFLLCFGGGLIVSWIAYRGALGNALLYAQQIKVAFDLYRNELLKQMRVPLPKTAAEERATWAAVKQLLYNNLPPGWDYTK